MLCLGAPGLGPYAGGAQVWEVRELGSQQSRDDCMTQFLFQWLSVIIQRFDAVLFGKSFLAAVDDPDM